MHLNELNGILAFMTPSQTGQPGQPQQSMLMSFLPMILLVVVFYFILIRPQQQRSKHQSQLLKNLKSGDKVVTAGGIVGVVITVKDKTVSLRSADAKMEITKSSVAEIIESGGATES
jgi:preprotein translocase subunit YajC